MSLLDIISFFIAGTCISFDMLILWSDISSTLMGLTVFFAIVQCMEYLGLNKHISMLFSTIKVQNAWFISFEFKRFYSRSIHSKALYKRLKIYINIKI